MFITRLYYKGPSRTIQIFPVAMAAVLHRFPLPGNPPFGVEPRPDWPPSPGIKKNSTFFAPSPRECPTPLHRVPICQAI